MKKDYDRSRERLERTERYRAKYLGGSGTLRAQMLFLRFEGMLVEAIVEDRNTGRSYKDVWAKIRRWSDASIAKRLFMVGRSVASAPGLGVPPDANPHPRDTALTIGFALIEKPRDLRWRAGMWGIDQLIKLPIFDLDDDGFLVLKLSAALNAELEKALRDMARTNPYLDPLCEPPPPWTGLKKGGLPVGHWGRPALVDHHPAVLRAVHEAIAENRMPKVLSAIHYLSRVPLAINTHILDYQNTWRPILPSFRGRQLPEERGKLVNLFEMQQQSEATERKQRERRKQLWQRQDEYAVATFNSDITTANAYADMDAFWEPLGFVFRSRIRWLCFFNYSRNDIVRALFQFAKGEQIGEEGIEYLKSHVAGKSDGVPWTEKGFKPSRLDFDRRRAWTNDNLGMIREVAHLVRRQDPALTKCLPDDDECEFLAACVELIDALDKGPNFITHLPITFDCSNSAWQHLFALTRAPEGRYVNLTANVEPGDLYLRIADRVVEDNPKHADLMREHGRKICKQSVMTLPYGATLAGMAKQIAKVDFLSGGDELLNEREANQAFWRVCRELAEAINAAIKQELPGAMQILKFLCELVMLYHQHGRLFRWSTLLGWPVVCASYKIDRDYRVKARRSRAHNQAHTGPIH